MFALLFHEQIARRKLSAPADWQACVFTRIGPDAIRLDGAVPRALARGPRKGQLTWRGMKLQSCVVTDAECDAERSTYELLTGNCSQCQGTKKVACGWSAVDGTRFQDCNKCKATGKPSHSLMGRESQ